MDIEEIKKLFAAAAKADEENRQQFRDETEAFFAALDTLGPRCTCISVADADMRIHTIRDPWCPVHKEFLFEYESKPE